MKNSNVEVAGDAASKNLGDGFIVRRSLPVDTKQMVGPFIFWDHMGPATISMEKPMKVRAHPHIGIATITYLFSGQIMHRDSLGNEQAIRPGEVNWMTTGSGIVHSERSIPQQEEVSLEGIQLWVALPKEHEETDASFIHVKEDTLPIIVQSKNNFRLIAGSAFGETSPIKTYSPLFYLTSAMRANSDFKMPLEKQHEGAVYVARGEVIVEGTKYTEGSLVVFKKGTEIEFSVERESQVMIFGGDSGVSA